MQKRLWSTAAIVGVAIIAGAIGKVGGRAIGEAAGVAQSGSTTVTQAERERAADNIDELIEGSALAEFYGDLQKADPAKSAAMREEMRKTMLEAASPAEAKERMRLFSAKLTQEYREYAPRASDAKLRAVVQTRLDLFRAVRDLSVDGCSELVKTGNWPGLPNREPYLSLLGKAATATLRAGIEGKTRAVRPQPSNAAFSDYGVKLVQAGVKAEELDALDGNKMSSLSSDRVCNLGITLLDVALKQKGPEVNNLLAVLTTES